MKTFAQYFNEAESMTSLGTILSLKRGDIITDNSDGKTYLIYSKDKEGETLLIPMKPDNSFEDYMVSKNWYDWVGKKGVVLQRTMVDLSKIPSNLKLKLKN